MSDLQELFARLKAQNSENSSAPPSAQQPSIWAAPQQRPPATLSSPLYSPPALSPGAVHAASIISPAPHTAGADSVTSDQHRTNNLLNLLKFNNQPSQSNAGPLADMQNVAGNTRSTSESFNATAMSENGRRPLLAQDLMASLQRKPSAPGVLPSPLAGPSAAKNGTTSTPSGSQQDFLLNLLRRPNSSKATESKEVESVLPSIETADQSSAKATSSVPDDTAATRDQTPARQFGSVSSRETTPFAAPQAAKSSQFTYVNPFEQLSSSSSLNRTSKREPHTADKKIEILKHDRDVSSANGDGAPPAAKSRKLASDGEPKSQSVAAAVENVGEKLQKEVQQALSEADGEIDKTSAVKSDPATTGAEVKKEPTRDDGVESSWESAEDSAKDSANEKKSEYKVKVYGFPMKPFESISVTGLPKNPLPLRQDDFMVIAQLKKDFDQMDRSLVAASQSYIVYAQSASKKDNNGFRVIRQDTGDHKQVFRTHNERVFSVQICSPPADSGSDVESVLATGVDGSVLWTSLAKSRSELFKDDDLEAQGFIMPAVATAEENTSGSPVKTRAKCSSRHTEIFALGRSKTIYIVAADAVKEKAYTNPSTRIADSEKFLAEHGLRINTGKAGKDFTFSEDDTVIASLDKSGVVKFWDIRDLVKRALDVTEEKHEPLELRNPIWTLTAVASGTKADEKPSVSSITLLDKERPHTKGIAMRYMLVGFKQNHILQLWDLGLGKPVQELRLPHEKDSDGFCSINYHPKSGIIAVGHPTRNSVYLIHLSAPKYNIPFTDQASYIRLLAKHDQSLPRPEATAIIDGLREFTFNKIGQLRSLEMLKTPIDNASEKGTEDETRFELYVMHHKGVFGTPIKNEDLGLNAQGKLEKFLNGVEEGVITVAELKFPPAKDGPSSETTSVNDTPSKKKETKKQEATKSNILAHRPAEAARKSANVSPAPAANRMSNVSKVPEPSEQVRETRAKSDHPANPPIITPDAYATAALPIETRAAESSNDESRRPLEKPEEKHDIKPVVDPNYLSALSDQFTSLYQRLDADKRVSEAAGAAKQDAVLRLVSSTLTENVEASLHRIINTSVAEKVIPVLVDSQTKLLDRKLSSILPQELASSVQKELSAGLPTALAQALKDDAIHRNIATSVGNNVTQRVQQQVTILLQQSLPNVIMQASQKMVADLEMRMNQWLNRAEQERQQANAQVERLSLLIQNMSGNMQKLVESQAALTEQMVTMQEERKVEQTKTQAKVEEVHEELDPAQEEVYRITQLLNNKEFEKATISWLQSTNQATLFDELFVHVDPKLLQYVSPLVSLSVSAAVTASLATNIDKRLEWLGAVLDTIDLRDPDCASIIPKVMGVLSQRLQEAYMQVSERDTNDRLLPLMSHLNKRVLEIKRLVS